MQYLFQIFYVSASLFVLFLVIFSFYFPYIDTMKKKRFSKILIVSTKENVLSILFVLFTLGLILFSTANITAAKKGLTLWANSVVPSLLPFFIATELLSHTPIVDYLGYICQRFMKPLFHVPGSRFLSIFNGNH